LNPTQATPTATYTLTAGGLVGDYSFNAHAAGTDPNAITHDAPLTLHVVDFNLTPPSPNSLSAPQGGTSGASTFQVTASGSFAGTVTLSCPTGLPTGAACVFSPSSSVNPTSSSPVTVTLTVTTGSGTPAGGPTTVTISAIATGAPAPKTQTFGLTVTGPLPDFSITVTATPNTTVANQNVTWNGTLTAKNGYSGSVTLTGVGTVPETWSILPATLTPTTSGASFTVTLGNATAAAFNFTIQATDGTLTHSTPTETLTVGTDVTWTDTGSTTATVSAGQSATYAFSAAPIGAASFTSAVSFACSGLPVLSSCVFNPVSIAAGAGTTPVTLTVRTTAPSSARGGVLQTASTTEGGRPYAILWAATVGIVALGQKRRRKTRLYGAIASICLLLGLSTLISCGGVGGGGGGGGGGGTPPGTSQITVAATAAGGSAQKDVVTLTVQ
jgi:plastocyanin